MRRNGAAETARGDVSMCYVAEWAGLTKFLYGSAATKKAEIETSKRLAAG